MEGSRRGIRGDVFVMDEMEVIVNCRPMKIKKIAYTTITTTTATTTTTTTTTTIHTDTDTHTFI